MNVPREQLKGFAHAMLNNGTASDTARMLAALTIYLIAEDERDEAERAERGAQG